MQAVFILAGKGKRMRESHAGPKHLIPLCGKPIIEHLLLALPKSVDELVLVVGGPYESAIRNYFGKIKDGRRVTYVAQHEPLGVGHAIQQTRDVVSGKFLVCLPDDVYCPSDLERLSNAADTALLVKKTDTPENFGIVVADEKGNVIDFVEKPKTFISNLAWTGAALFDEDFFTVEALPTERGEIETATILMKLIRERNKRVKTIEATYWFPINNPAELAFAESELKNSKRGLPE